MLSYNETRGFTLVELLVVIAIIAILVVIVIAAINPAKILKDTRDRSMEANVRSAGSTISVCLTDKIEKSAVSHTIIYSNNAANGCANPAVVARYGSFATDVVLTFYNTGGQYKLCAHQVSNVDGAVTSWNSRTGELKKAGSGSVNECASY